jgi:hypothetical protein
MGKRCLPSRPRGPAPKISPARKGGVHSQAVERRRCGTRLFACSLGATNLEQTTALSFVIPSEAEGSAVPFPRNKTFLTHLLYPEVI